MTDHSNESTPTSSGQRRTVASTSATFHVLGGQPDPVETQALLSVIEELAAVAKAERASRPQRGQWGAPSSSMQPLGSFNPRSYQNTREDS